MITQTAQSALAARPRADSSASTALAVVSVATLRARGCTRSEIAAQLAAQRWQQRGAAIVLHNGPLTRRQRWRVALLNSPPGAMLTAFTAAEFCGLTGWERDDIHVLASAGARRNQRLGLDVRLHRTVQWPAPRSSDIGVHALPAALTIAASSFSTARPACGLLAAAVQQRLVDPAVLLGALQDAPKVRHRPLMLSAVGDIAGGAQALSEIDFVNLCRAAKLPLPELQRVRLDLAGRRRYLDASWHRSDGRLVVVEVDGALHLSPKRWWDDQLRQNELVLTDALVLRFPSAVLRCEPDIVLGQLRRALMV